MPNWVMNLVRVNSDTAEELQNFKKQIQSPEENKLFDFNKIIPMPKEIAEANDCSWYTWAIKNWGTKWNANEVEIAQESDTYMEYNFLTAWSLPYPIYKKLWEMFPRIRFEVIFAEENDSELSGMLTFCREDHIWEEYWSENEEDSTDFFIQCWGFDPNVEQEEEDNDSNE